MHWELQQFNLDETPGALKVFTYEVTLKGLDGTPQLTLRGDGIHRSDGTVRLNRESEIRQLLDGTQVNAQQLVDHLAVCVRTRAEKLLLRRMVGPGQEARPAASLRY